MLTDSEKGILYLIAWQGSRLPPSWRPVEEVARLEERGLVTAFRGSYEVTPAGFSLLSDQACRALKRPLDFLNRPEAERWEIDKSLGILNWDGT